MSAPRNAWQLLGTDLDAPNAHAALEQAGLAGWDVRKAKVYADLSPLRVPIPNTYAVVRNHPYSQMNAVVLGVVGADYRVTQNEDYAPLLNALADESGARFAVAGSLDGGAKVFVTLALPGYMLVGGTDRVEHLMTLVFSHDGSMAASLIVTPVRVACQTSLGLSPDFGTGSRLKVQRPGTGNTPVFHARDLLDKVYDYLDGFQELANDLARAEMSQAGFERLAAAEFGAKAGAPASTVTRCENKVARVAELFADLHTTGVRETGWAALVAIASWYDHHAPTRGEARVSARAIKAVLNPAPKDRALARLTFACDI